MVSEFLPFALPGSFPVPPYLSFSPMSFHFRDKNRGRNDRLMTHYAEKDLDQDVIRTVITYSGRKLAGLPPDRSTVLAVVGPGPVETIDGRPAGFARVRCGLDRIGCEHDRLVAAHPAAVC